MPPCHGGDRRFESGRARQTVFSLLRRNTLSGSLKVRTTFLLLKFHLEIRLIIILHSSHNENGKVYLVQCQEKIYMKASVMQFSSIIIIRMVSKI